MNVNYYYISSNWEHFSLNVLIQITPSMRKVVNPLQLMIRVHQSVRKLVKKKVWLIFNKYTYLGQFRYLSLLSMWAIPLGPQFGPIFQFSYCQTYGQVM